MVVAYFAWNQYTKINREKEERELLNMSKLNQEQAQIDNNKEKRSKWKTKSKHQLLAHSSRLLSQA
jgi:hypothetical protein